MASVVVGAAVVGAAVVAGAASVVSVSSPPQADNTNSNAASTAIARTLPSDEDLGTLRLVMLKGFLS